MKQLIFLCVLGVVIGSCSDMDESIKEFVTDTTTYPGKFDAAQPTRIGYENVEINLLKAGRIPSSQIHLGRATKTVVEYGNDESLVIDSVCSWVKVTGLTQQTTYKFIIYSMDEYGNKSVPIEVFLTPFTAADKAFLVIPAPMITPGATAATIQWMQDITNTGSLTYLGLTYSYTDKNGQSVEGTRDAIPVQQRPILTLPDVPNNGTTVNIKYRVIPKVNQVQIIDTIWLERSLVIPPL